MGTKRANKRAPRRLEVLVLLVIFSAVAFILFYDNSVVFSLFIGGEKKSGKEGDKIIFLDPVKGLLQFEVSEGLVNQRIAIINGILIGAVTGRRVVLPNLHSSFDKTQGQQLGFNQLYNTSLLREKLSDVVDILDRHETAAAELVLQKGEKGKMPIEVRFREHKAEKWHRISKDAGHILRLGCTFSSIRINNPELYALVWRIDQALIFHSDILEQADKVMKGMSYDYTALHFRTEDDWITHCRQWEKQQQMQYNCMSNTKVINNVFTLEQVPTSRPVYIAGGYTREFIAKNEHLQGLVPKYKIITKEMYLPNLNLAHDLMSKRELFAAIDFVICLGSPLFVGNSVSTFSALLELRRLQEQLPVFHYNGGDIPLRTFLPITHIAQRKPLKWVFTMALNKESDEDYLIMAKVAVLSALENTMLQPVCMMTVEDKDRDVLQVRSFIRWLHEQEVIILEHTPTWEANIKEIGDTLNRNSVYSPLYTSTSSMISTFLRIDIPIVGFVDDYVL